MLSIFLHNIYIDELLTLTMLASKIANNGWTAPFTAHAIQAIKIVVHSGLLIDKSLIKIDFRLDDAEFFLKRDS